MREKTLVGLIAVMIDITSNRAQLLGKVVLNMSFGGKMTTPDYDGYNSRFRKHHSSSDAPRSKTCQPNQKFH